MVYNNEEENDLELTRTLRKSMLESIFRDGVPKDTRLYRVANEIMNSMDTSVHTKAGNRLKHQEVQNTEAILNTVTETLRNAQLVMLQNNKSRTIELQDEYVPVDIVPGETDITPEKLELRDFVREIGN